jgi:hypothetical protein
VRGIVLQVHARTAAGIQPLWTGPRGGALTGNAEPSFCAWGVAAPAVLGIGLHIDARTPAGDQSLWAGAAWHAGSGEAGLSLDAGPSTGSTVEGIDLQIHTGSIAEIGATRAGAVAHAVAVDARCALGARDAAGAAGGRVRKDIDTPPCTGHRALGAEAAALQAATAPGPVVARCAVDGVGRAVAVRVWTGRGLNDLTASASCDRREEEILIPDRLEVEGARPLAGQPR